MCQVQHYVPTQEDGAEPCVEGISGESVKHVGDVMYDAAHYYGDKAEQSSNLTSKGYVLLTLHRQENVDDRMRLANIFQNFATSDFPIVMPLPPRTRKLLHEFGFNLLATVKLIDPLGYVDMAKFEKRIVMIATDSGGVQKEAYFQDVPCVTLCDQTK